MARIQGLLVLACLALSTSTPAAGKTYVTSYVTEVQEERRSTRWTLTEWLRIKERMRMMDLWLAMFSDPVEDEFRPGVGVDFFGVSGSAQWQPDGGEASSSAVRGRGGRAELWLTNLLTSATGWSLLDVEIGVRGETIRTTGADRDTAKTAAVSMASPIPRGGGERQSYGGTLRLFGDHIQDSSLSAFYGRYNREWAPALADGATTPAVSGDVWGGNLNLYFTDWLGLEGDYQSFGNDPTTDSSEKGERIDARVFLEMSLLRISAGRFQETWSGLGPQGKDELSSKGVLGGLAVQL